MECKVKHSLSTYSSAWVQFIPCTKSNTGYNHKSKQERQLYVCITVLLVLVTSVISQIPSTKVMKTKNIVTTNWATLYLILFICCLFFCHDSTM